MRKFIGIPLLIYFSIIAFVYFSGKEIYKRNQPYTEDAEAIDSVFLQEKKVLSVEELIGSYIDSNKQLAIEEMRQMGIPASISLAQAILESRYGTSDLAIQAQNHFGIKATEDWTGDRNCLHSLEWIKAEKRTKSILSCFRSYADRKEGFRDHSLFLKERKYYKKLFKLDIKDYRAWAEGLQKAGYATDPQYATKLIRLIEQYELNQLDSIAVNNNKHKI